MSSICYDRDQSMERVAARELKQHTGEIIERVQRGERLLLTHRGNPVAIISLIAARSTRSSSVKPGMPNPWAGCERASPRSHSGTTQRTKCGTASARDQWF